ncbi:MAG: hydroxymethylbilane synthase, partial [Frankiaceae bacterium]|nr:hydroxymethylbilane synthase [Frankiaceae bacterium]
ALRLGTRRSRLAMAQSQQVADALTARLDRPVELVEVVTYGDRSTEALTQIGGTGVFVTALREALLDKQVDLAVHSLKDLPTAPAADLLIAAVPERQDPRDVLVSPSGLTLGELPTGSRIGTGSPRRAAQLRALGLGLEMVPIRGNVDTRIRKAVDGEVDAVVLARAGLARLGRLADVTEVLDPLQLLPACGQGALAIECRAVDEQLADELHDALDDAMTRAAVTAERSLLATLEAGCTAPVGGLADVAEDEDGRFELYLRGVVASIDGGRAIRLSATGSSEAPEALGRRLAADLLEAGAADLLGAT